MEKVLDLKMPSVQELGREELREVEGGNPLSAIAAAIAIAGACIYVYNNFDDFVEGYKEGWAESTK